MKKYLSKKYIIIYVVIAILSVAGYYGNEYSSKVEVDLHTVDTGEVIELLLEDGYIEASKTAEVQSSISGIVEEVFATTGDVVNKDDVLLVFDDDVLNLQLEQLDAQIKSLDFQLLEASKPADRERINNASILVNQAKTNRDQSKKDYDSNLALFNSGSISKNELEASENIYNANVSSYNLAVNDLRLLNKGISSNIKSQYNASIEALYAQKKIIEKQIGDYSIKTSMSGTVLSNDVKVGHFVNVGQQLYEIADLSRLRLVCDILEDDYNAINTDSIVNLHDKNTNEYYSAKITKIYPKSETTISELGIKQNRVKVEIEPTDKLTGYIVGQELDVEFEINKSENSIRVPIDSVYKSKGEYFVFTINEGMLASTLVEIGIEGEDYYEIKSGLTEGAEIVKLITNDLSEGQKLK